MKNLSTTSPYQLTTTLHFAETARALVILTKPRLAFFSVLTTMAAYGAAQGQQTTAHAIATLIGTALAAGGALSLNHWWERDTDGLMQRTCSRPLPSNTISPLIAITWSFALSIAGVSLLSAVANQLAAGLAAATILIYGLIYTPMKRHSRWATEIGSISGALPALIGNAAADNIFAAPGLCLFAILLFWQMPHFYAIGWKYREDYRAAGLPLLPAIDTDGARTARWSLGYTICLCVISILPFIFGYMGAIYGIVILAANFFYLRAAIAFFKETKDRDATAKRLFFVSIIYLPIAILAIISNSLI